MSDHTEAPADRPGWKTTEFWLSALSTLIGLIFASGLPSDHIVIRLAGMAAMVLSQLGYTVTRTSLKKARPGGNMMLAGRRTTTTVISE